MSDFYYEVDTALYVKQIVSSVVHTEVGVDDLTQRPWEIRYSCLGTSANGRNWEYRAANWVIV